jgi:hypothetical protein
MNNDDEARIVIYDASSEKTIFHYFRESDTGSLKDEKRHSAEVSFLFVFFKYLIGQTLKDRLIRLNVPKSGGSPFKNKKND